MPYDAQRRGVTQAQWVRLSQRVQGRPRIAFAGEFSAGKSSLINLLLQQDVLPVRNVPTALPPIWLQFGADPGWAMLACGKRIDLPAAGLAALPRGVKFVRLHAKADLLRHCDLIDLPGISDPDQADADVHPMLKMAHLAVWCTPATQAWRQSEHSFWSHLPSRLRRHSLLACTRIDQLASLKDQRQVLARLSHETTGLFSTQLPISAVMAAQSIRDNDDMAEAASGYPNLVEHLLTALHEIKAARRELLGRYTLIAAAPPEVSPQCPERSPQVAQLSFQKKAVMLTERIERMVEETARAEAFFTRLPPVGAWQMPQLPAPKTPLPDSTVCHIETAHLARSELSAANTAQPCPPPPFEAAGKAEITLLPIARLAAQHGQTKVAHEVQLWRDLVAQDPNAAQNAQMIALFDRFLVALTQKPTGEKP